MTTVAFTIVVFIVAVLLNGLFAGYETGFVSADRIRIRYLAEEEKNKRAAQLMRHLTKPDRMLTTVLIGTNVALIVGTLAITEPLKARGIEWLAVLIATPVFLIFAEVVPKNVFRRHPNRLSLRLYPIIRFFDFIFAPLVIPTMFCLHMLLRITGADQQHLRPVMASEKDFRLLVDESAEHGSIEPEEQAMIHSVMDLPSIQAKEIMVPRIDVDALPETATRDELIELFMKTGRTRIPIYRETIDTVIGVANVYEVLLDSQPEQQSITRFAQIVAHVPDTMPVDDLLQELKRSKEHMAIVTDEYGGTDGVITLEDILEEIFGEIHDEHDQARDMIQQVGPHAYVVDARMPLEDFSEVVGLDVSSEEVETVGGWVLRGAGRIPMQGEKIKHEGFRITILDGGRNQVSKVRVELLPEARMRLEQKDAD